MNTIAKAAPRPIAVWKLVFAGAALSLGIGVFLSLWAHIIVAAGTPPEAMNAADWLGPLLAIFSSSAWAARRTQIAGTNVAGWKIGGAIALLSIAFWQLYWCLVMARWNFAAWPHDAFGTLTWRHGKAWLLALLFGALGGKFAYKQATPRLFLGGIAVFTLVFLTFAMKTGAFMFRLAEFRASDVRMGVNLRIAGRSLRNYSASPDGTGIRLLEIDLAKAPPLHFGLYDADSDDAQPFDDRNTTWLGQSIDFVSDKLKKRETARNRDVLCIVNGGFFGGGANWTAHHEAPLTVNGTARYDSRTLENDWPEQACTLAVSKTPGGKPQFHLLPDAKFTELKKYEMALGGVRALRINGQSLELKPGMGGTKLRTSRTSIGWSANSSQFFVLSVRDPDGEAASNRQKTLGQAQSGGWDVAQVQQFWEKRSVANAVLFDGGESTQLAYGGGLPVIVRCGYSLARTLGYWKERPLRAVFPLLPPEMNGGVLNYFYITAPKR